jgi:hypothetical protein
MISLLLTIMGMLIIPPAGNTNLFSTNTTNAQDYNHYKYRYYYYPPDDYTYECQKGSLEVFMLIYVGPISDCWSNKGN